MPYPAATVDAEGVLRDWLNTLTSTLVGVGRPLTGGVFLDQPTRSPGKGTWAVITRIGGTDAWNEAQADNARITCSIFSISKLAALNGARAYANTIRGLAAAPQLVDGVRIMTVDNVAGPTWIPNPAKALPQYLVDADVYFLSS